MNGFRISMLAGAAALALAAGSVASAQGMSADGFYLKGFGGASFAQDEDFDVSLPREFEDAGVGLTEDVSYDTGYLLGAAIGYDITPSIAGELEYTYRSANAALGAEISGPDGTEKLDPEDGDVTTSALMLNGIYNFPGMGAMAAVQPYVGIGIGGAQVDFDGDSTDFEFAYQAMAGVTYAVNPNVDLFAEARWFSTDGGEFFSEDGFSAEAGFDSIDLLVGAAYNF